VSETDRRVKTISTTDKGVHMDRHAKRHLREIEELYVAGFTDDEKKTLRGMLSRVLENVIGGEN
jgi:DNA-binding MarR family transcriptional regulator